MKNLRVRLIPSAALRREAAARRRSCRTITLAAANHRSRGGRCGRARRPLWSGRCVPGHRWMAGARLQRCRRGRWETRRPTALRRVVLSAATLCALSLRPPSLVTLEHRYGLASGSPGPWSRAYVRGAAATAPSWRRRSSCGGLACCGAWWWLRRRWSARAHLAWTVVAPLFSSCRGLRRCAGRRSRPVSRRSPRRAGRCRGPRVARRTTRPASRPRGPRPPAISSCRHASDAGDDEIEGSSPRARAPRPRRRSGGPRRGASRAAADAPGGRPLKRCLGSGRRSARPLDAPSRPPPGRRSGVARGGSLAAARRPGTPAARPIGRLIAPARLRRILRRTTAHRRRRRFVTSMLRLSANLATTTAALSRSGVAPPVRDRSGRPASGRGRRRRAPLTPSPISVHARTIAIASRRSSRRAKTPAGTRTHV